LGARRARHFDRSRAQGKNGGKKLFTAGQKSPPRERKKKKEKTEGGKTPGGAHVKKGPKKWKGGKDNLPKKKSKKKVFEGHSLSMKTRGQKRPEKRKGPSHTL